MSTKPTEGVFAAIICDGNRRDESELIHQEQGLVLPPTEFDQETLYNAYQRGGKAIRDIVECARDQSVGILAAWAWSTKNMERRSEHERKAVFRVIQEFVLDLEENWMNLPENNDVRLVHMGRQERLNEADPGMMHIVNRVCKDTRGRTGMVVALCMDYGGPDETKRAKTMWRQAGYYGELEDYLDLPRQGVPYRPMDLRIRTGETDRAKHLNAYLHPYEGEETREIFHELYLPGYTPNLFINDLQELNRTPMRKGA